jgi:hypothetical protein
MRCQQRTRYESASGLSRTSQHPAHSALYRTDADALQELLAGVILRSSDGSDTHTSGGASVDPRSADEQENAVQGGYRRLIGGARVFATLKGYSGTGLRTVGVAVITVTGMNNIEDDLYNEGNGDPHDQVVRLEALIEELTAKIESCRKFILASRIVTWGGGVVLFAMLFGVMRFDLGIMAAAVAALLGGIVIWGSNSSTVKEAAKELAVAEADRVAVITIINPRAIPSGHAAPAKAGPDFK